MTVYPAGRAAPQLNTWAVGWVCRVLLEKQSRCRTLARGGQSLTSVLHVFCGSLDESSSLVQSSDFT